MADPVNGLLAARMDPERRRRIGNALLAYQYDRETPQDAAVTERAGLFPLATYANGQTGIAWPGIVATPVEKMAQVLRGEITPGTPEFNEAGFDIAGAAMVGGLAAARPKTPPQPLIGYRGSPFEGGHTRNHFWASADRGMAGDYAMVPGNDKNPRHAPNVTPAEFRFKNPLTINAKGDYWDYIKRDGLRTSTDGLADDALFAGHDGIIIKNVVDPVGNASQLPQTTIAALQRGTVYSPLTGDLLYANARPGAALGAGLSGVDPNSGVAEILNRYGLGHLVRRPAIPDDAT